MFRIAATEEFLEVRFQTDSIDRASHELAEADPSQPFRFVVTPSVHHMVLFLERRHQLNEIFAAAWRTYCDSRVLSGLARLFGKRLAVVPGSDLTRELLRLANDRRMKIALIGPTIEAAKILAQRYPNLQIVSHCPPPGFIERKDEVAACVEFVVREQAPLVFLAVGAPRQEILGRHISADERATGIGLCIGASIDFLTGKQRRAPAWMQRTGLEWFFRLLSDPRRLASRYLLECPKIFYLMLRVPRVRDQRPSGSPPHSFGLEPLAGAANGTDLLLSVVIPSCGRDGFLDAIDSALSQDLPPGVTTEVVLVDNTREGRLGEQLGPRRNQVRTVHQAASGVSQARNCGIGEARGSYIAFLDDDELARPGWASALAGHARAGCKAVFGPVHPCFEVDAGECREPALRIFRRAFPYGDGADITAHYAHLGTGNSMFHRSCFIGDAPFDPTLSKLGGEDSAFVRSLVQRGVRLTWAAAAEVEEHVGADRLTHASIATRFFRQGQIRSVVRFRSPGLGKLEGVGWMVVGLAQACLWGSLALALAPIDAIRARRYRLSANAGLGKVFWGSTFWPVTYGTGAPKQERSRHAREAFDN